MFCRHFCAIFGACFGAMMAQYLVPVLVQKTRLFLRKNRAMVFLKKLHYH